MNKRFEGFDLALNRNAHIRSDNALKEFLDKNNLKKDKDVVEVYLPNEDLTELRSLDRFKNMTKLWLQSNRLKCLPFIQNCYSLSEIYLQNNLIQSIEFSFRNLYNLSVIFLQGNQLTDLNGTAIELSYLKCLKNLNLFDNPISLEKNYKRLIVYKVPSLEVFDRNTIKPIEKSQSIVIYEPEKIRIRKKYAFLRCKSQNKIQNNLAKKKDRFNLTDSISSFNFSLCSESYNEKENNEENLKKMDKKNFIQSSHNNLYLRKSLTNLNRSIKEFAFFDWSKVNIYENRNYLESDDNNLDSFNKNSLQKHKKISELPQIVSIRFT